MAKNSSPESDNPYDSPWAKDTADFLVKKGYSPTTRIAYPDNVHVGKILDDIDNAPPENRRELNDEYNKRTTG